MTSNQTKPLEPRQLSSEQIQQQENLYNGYQLTIKNLSKFHDELFRDRVICGLALLLAGCTYLAPLRLAYVGLFKVAEATGGAAKKMEEVIQGGVNLDPSGLKVGDTVKGARKGNGSVPSYPITSGFGPRVSPTSGASKLHKGVDAGLPIGTPLYQPINTEVKVTCANQPNGAGLWGQMDFVAEGKTITIKAFHLSKCENDKAKGGQIIFLSGNTGVSTGPHLHFQQEVDGVAVDPYRGLVEAMTSGNPVRVK